MDFLKNTLSTHYRWERLQKGNGKIPAEYKPSFTFCGPKITMGIEVEVENIPRADLDNKCDWNYWHVKEDGSLRNHGYEYVSFPLTGKEIDYAVNNLFGALPKKADFSDRTSIHIHENMRNKTCKDIVNILMLYLVFEKLLYNFAGPARYKNIFCVPVQDTKLPIALSNYLTHGDLKVLVREWSKYSGLNIVPLKHLGSIEFRHMHGNRDVEYILRWINIIQRITIYAVRMEFLDLFNELRTLNTTSGYEALVMRVFEEDSRYLLNGVSDIQGLMESGAAAMKMISLPSAFSQRLLAEVSVESPLFKALGVTKIPTLKPVDQTINQYLDANAGRMWFYVPAQGFGAALDFNQMQADLDAMPPDGDFR